MLEELVEPEWGDLIFFRTGEGEIGVMDRRGQEFAIGGQGVLVDSLPELNAFIRESRESWEARMVSIHGFPALVSDAAVMGGSPVVAGTRIETAFIAYLGAEMGMDDLFAAFPHVARGAIREAIRFEGLPAAA